MQNFLSPIQKKIAAKSQKCKIFPCCGTIFVEHRKGFFSMQNFLSPNQIKKSAAILGHKTGKFWKTGVGIVFCRKNEVEEKRLCSPLLGGIGVKGAAESRTNETHLFEKKGGFRLFFYLITGGSFINIRGVHLLTFSRQNQQKGRGWKMGQRSCPLEIKPFRQKSLISAKTFPILYCWHI